MDGKEHDWKIDDRNLELPGKKCEDICVPCGLSPKGDLSRGGPVLWI